MPVHLHKPLTWVNEPQLALCMYKLQGCPILITPMAVIVKIYPLEEKNCSRTEKCICGINN